MQLQEVFTIHSFMRLSSAGYFLYGCKDCYFFFSKPFDFSSVYKPNRFEELCQDSFHISSVFRFLQHQVRKEYDQRNRYQRKVCHNISTIAYSLPSIAASNRACPAHYAFSPPNKRIRFPYLAHTSTTLSYACTPIE